MISNFFKIILYSTLIFFKDNQQQVEEDYKTVYEGLAEQFRIKGLTPSTRYRLRLIATNSDGDSQPSAAISISTSALFHPPKQPHCPQLVSVSAKCIKLSWNTQPQHSYTVCTLIAIF